MSDFFAFISEQWLLFSILSALLMVWYILEKRNSVGSVNPQEAVMKLNNNDCTAIDVRTEKDFNDGHISGSINVPYKNSQFIKNIEQYKDKTLLLVCDKGMQSKAVANQLKSQGFTCLNLDGGIGNWRLDNFPINKHSDDKKIKKTKNH